MCPTDKCNQTMLSFSLGASFKKAECYKKCGVSICLLDNFLIIFFLNHHVYVCKLFIQAQCIFVWIYWVAEFVSFSVMLKWCVGEKKFTIMYNFFLHRLLFTCMLAIDWMSPWPWEPKFNSISVIIGRRSFSENQGTAMR